MPTTTTVLIGPAEDCLRLERQLALLPRRPICIGWVVTDPVPDEALRRLGVEATILGGIADLESAVLRRRPGVAMVTMPAAMRELIDGVRTRLRRLGVPDRFMPTLADQVAGIGPRTELIVDPAQLLDRAPRKVDDRSIRSVIEGQTVAITGAGGSIGGELSRLVARYEPRRLLLIERSEGALFDIDRQVARTAPDVPRTAILHDIVDAEGTLDHFARWRPGVVFHAAAHKHVPVMEDHPAAAVDNNLFGTMSAVDAAVAVGTERFVMISTDKAVNPSSIMGATKRLAEQYVQHVHGRGGALTGPRNARTGCSLVRFGNVLGSSGSALSIWARQVAEGGPVTVTHPLMTRYFMTIPEAASLVVQSAALHDPDRPGGEVFVLDMGEPVSILELVRRFVEAHGLTARVPGEPEPEAGAGVIDVVFTGARPGEKLFEELALDSESIQPTRHPGIRTWALPAPDPAFVSSMLETLRPGARPSSPARLAALIRGLIPEMTAPVAA